MIAKIDWISVALQESSKGMLSSVTKNKQSFLESATKHRHSSIRLFFSDERYQLVPDRQGPTVLVPATCCYYQLAACSLQLPGCVPALLIMAASSCHVLFASRGVQQQQWKQILLFLGVKMLSLNTIHEFNIKLILRQKRTVKSKNRN